MDTKINKTYTLEANAVHTKIELAINTEGLKECKFIQGNNEMLFTAGDFAAITEALKSLRKEIMSEHGHDISVFNTETRKRVQEVDLADAINRLGDYDSASVFYRRKLIHRDSMLDIQAANKE